MTSQPAIHGELFTASAPVHIVGVGGAGMSGIARILRSQGIPVTGSDAKDSRRVTALEALGVQVAIGHQAENLHLAGVLPAAVVASTAIKPENPEMVAARAAGVPVLTRAQALASVVHHNPTTECIAVTGTHGKTTTTSMVTVALQACGADPSFAIGSELNEAGSNAHVGSGVEFVVEADESDGTFLQLRPRAAIVTNIEPDHLDHWKTETAMRQAFVDFTHRLQPDTGIMVLCVDDPGVRQLLEQLEQEQHLPKIVTYGRSDQADYRIELLEIHEGCWRFEVVAHGVRLGALTLQVPGEHNVLNATAALVTGIELGYPAMALQQGLAEFTGTKRRFEYRGTVAQIRLYDDYAHHPTEIFATLRAAREVAGDGRVVAAFQAHHFYRTDMYREEFGQALGLADEVVVLEVFAPGEIPIPGATGQGIAAAVPLPPERVHFEPSFSQAPATLAAAAQPGDLLITLGAGEVGMLGAPVLAELRERFGQENDAS